MERKKKSRPHNLSFFCKATYLKTKFLFSSTWHFFSFNCGFCGFKVFFSPRDSVTESSSSVLIDVTITFVLCLIKGKQILAAWNNRFVNWVFMQGILAAEHNHDDCHCGHTSLLRKLQLNPIVEGESNYSYKFGCIT